MDISQGRSTHHLQKDQVECKLFRILYESVDEKVKASKTTIEPSSELKEESGHTIFSNCKIEERPVHPSMQLL
jgi:hypothetical protein